ncbi:hypothetical protein B0H14DRAFT_3869249 [Mycena olivaceomarginata]|nr:hypothetical protein B0H14DRAFT_3869249 [Mycena olivaceomarginata]
MDTLEEVVVGLSPAPASASKRIDAAPSAGGMRRAVVEEREEEAPPETEDGWLEVGRKTCTVGSNRPNRLLLTRIFGGRFRSTLRAEGLCDWRRLNIQRDDIHTITDALAPISHPQTVQMSHPSCPGIVGDASSQKNHRRAAAHPHPARQAVLLRHDTAVGGVVKVGKRVAVGPELEVGNDELTPTARKLDVLSLTRFLGSAAGTGSEREGRLRIDDELVSDVRPVDVCAEGYSRCAYLLFYRRVR